MTENTQQEQLSATQPTFNPPKVWLPFVFALIAVAVISGGGVYIWQQNTIIKQLQANLPRQTDYTDDQVVSTIEPTTVQQQIPATATLAPIDNRKVLSADEWQKKFTSEFNKGVTCNKFFESRFQAEPNTTVDYSNNKYGYSIELPFNQSWGDDENKVKPFENNNYGSGTNIWFGRPYSSEGCSFYRISMAELPATTIDNEINNIKTENQKIKNNPNSSQLFYKYEKTTNLEYPTLRINIPSDMFGEIISYKVFLPKVTLEFSDPFSVDEKFISKLVNSTKLL